LPSKPTASGANSAEGQSSRDRISADGKSGNQNSALQISGDGFSRDLAYVDRFSGGARTAILAAIAFAICSIAAAITSKGFLEADGGTHYLYARHAIQQPFYFVDVWGRPLCTALFALPATFAGLIGVRMVSLAAALGCGLIAFSLAKFQGYRWPALAMIFTLGQPLLFLHSFSELTELPFAFVIGLALLAYQRKRWMTFAICMAIAPLGRPEGFVLLILAGFALTAHRRWRCLVVLPMGLIAWSLAGHFLAGPADGHWWRWLIDHWAWESGSEYPRQPIWHFLIMLPMLIGPFAFPAMWIGMGLGLREWRGLLRGEGEQDENTIHRASVGFLIAALPLSIFLGHSLLSWLGKLSSNGELRYLLIVSPMWGVLTARGWAWVFDRLNWRSATKWAALAAVVPGLVNYAWRVLPLQEPTSWQEARRVVAWYQSRDVHNKYPLILTNHPGIFYYLDVSPSDRSHIVPWTKAAADHPPAGTLLLWDPEYAVRNAAKDYVVPLDEVIDAGWINDWRGEWDSNVNNPPPWDNYKILSPPPEPKQQTLVETPMLWHIFLSPVDRDGNPTPMAIQRDGDHSWPAMPGEPALPVRK
jgi:hypothetical protein